MPNAKKAAKPRRTSRTDRARETFLATLRETCNVSAAARAAKIGRSTAYDWRDADEAFAAAWDDAEEEAVDALEMRARERALDNSDRMMEILLKAHRAIESITLDREVAHLKDELMPRYAKLIYNGYWWSPERRMLQAAIDETQKNVSGVVRMKLYKGNATVVGRKSEQSLFDESIATFEDDAGAYNQKDAEGFIKLNALRLRIAAGKGRKL